MESNTKCLEVPAYQRTKILFQFFCETQLQRNFYPILVLLYLLSKLPTQRSPISYLDSNPCPLKGSTLTKIEVDMIGQVHRGGLRRQGLQVQVQGVVIAQVVGYIYQHVAWNYEGNKNLIRLEISKGLFVLVVPLRA